MKLNLTIPVYNEERRLASCLERLIPFLSQRFLGRCELIIADNGSTDRTDEIASEYAGRTEFLSYLRIEEKGRGRALREAWSRSTADIVSYMDVDLSTDIAFFPLLIECLRNDTFQIAVGSRALSPSLTRRGLRREVLSRGYRMLVRLLFQAGFSDPQCGFKAMKRECARAVLPEVRNQRWFFDTELLILAEAMGCRIYDLPVVWTENLDSRVAVWSTIREDIAGLLELRWRMARFARRGSWGKAEV